MKLKSTLGVLLGVILLTTGFCGVVSALSLGSPCNVQFNSFDIVVSDAGTHSVWLEYTSETMSKSNVFTVGPRYTLIGGSSKFSVTVTPQAAGYTVRVKACDGKSCTAERVVDLKKPTLVEKYGSRYLGVLVTQPVIRADRYSFTAPIDATQGTTWIAYGRYTDSLSDWNQQYWSQPVNPRLTKEVTVKVPSALRGLKIFYRVCDVTTGCSKIERSIGLPWYGSCNSYRECYEMVRIAS